MLQIHLFGHLQIFDGDSLLPPLNPPKAQALLAYLLIRRERAIPRDQVAFTLWADASESEARANLRRHLHLLRSALPAPRDNQPWVLTEHGSVQWNGKSDYWLDVEAFEQASHPNQTADPAILQSAIEIYRGDLLENFYEDWALTERQRLREGFTDALTRLEALQESAGDFRGAILTAKRLLAHDPLREETHRSLMQLHYQAGDRAAALGQFEECRRVLREKLNVEPMAETRALAQSIAESQMIARRRLPISDSPPAASSTLRDSPPAEPTSLRAPEGRTPRPKPRGRHPVRWVALAVMLIAAALAVILFFNPFLPRESVTFSGAGVAQDTWLSPEHPDALFDPSFPKIAFREYSQSHLQYYGAGTDRFLIRFDLGAMPADAKIKTAVLRIHLETWISETGQNSLLRAYPARVAVYRIRRAWTVDSATFNAPWSLAGLGIGTDTDATPLASLLISDTDWLEFDITSAARDWLAHPQENWGVALMITDAPEGVAHYWVDTTENPDSGKRPRLVIEY